MPSGMAYIVIDINSPLHHDEAEESLTPLLKMKIRTLYWERNGNRDGRAMYP